MGETLKEAALHHKTEIPGPQHRVNTSAEISADILSGQDKFSIYKEVKSALDQVLGVAAVERSEPARELAPGDLLDAAAAAAEAVAEEARAEGVDGGDLRVIEVMIDGDCGGDWV